MALPLYEEAVSLRPRRAQGGHTGLWFDKFCDQWSADWSMSAAAGTEGGGPKLVWLNKVKDGQLRPPHGDEVARRRGRLVDAAGGKVSEFVAESRFVTGLGRSHPVENGFAWHPTLGTPYLSGSSVKGIVRAWATRAMAAGQADKGTIGRILGKRDEAGSVCFLDAITVGGVQLEVDVMTPHYAGWTKDSPPGDWRSPTPIPFLVAAAGTCMQFGIVPRLTAEGLEPEERRQDVARAFDWMVEALTWLGAGAKTAVGYGRFKRQAGGNGPATRAPSASTRNGGREEVSVEALPLTALPAAFDARFKSHSEALKAQRTAKKREKKGRTPRERLLDVVPADERYLSLAKGLQLSMLTTAGVEDYFEASQQCGGGGVGFRVVAYDDKLLIEKIKVLT